ncbi:MAG: S8 family serine peptidase [Phycisphaeraceae bacterium]|nr:S8 family serine peptidase [Phycisphaeraceae bacterium]
MARADQDWAPGRVLVLPQVPEHGATVRLAAEALGYRVVFQTPISGLVCLEVPPGREQEHCALLRGRGLPVRTVCRDPAGRGGMQPFYPTIPNDPEFSTQWNLRNIGQVAFDEGCPAPQNGYTDSDIDIEEAWEITQGSPDIEVAVFDTGIDLTHPQFVGRLSPHVIDATGGTGQDTNGHGTGVASIIGANVNDGPGPGGEGAGVDPNCTLVAVRLNQVSGGTLSQTLFGLETIIANPNFAGVRVINMSYMFVCPEEDPSAEVLVPVREALGLLKSFNVIVVVIATNLGDGAADVFCPSKWPEVITVSATDNKDLRGYTCIGPTGTGNAVDLAAPGVAVWAARCVNVPPCEPYSPHSSGTSLAAPQVAGAVSLLMARADTLGITLTWDMVYSILTKSAIDIGATGHDPVFGWGRLNVAAALRRLENDYYDCDADLTLGDMWGVWGYGVADGLVDQSDMNYYIQQYNASNLDIADLTTTGAGSGQPGYGVPDGVVNSDDFLYYSSLWVAGCP